MFPFTPNPHGRNLRYLFEMTFANDSIIISKRESLGHLGRVSRPADANPVVVVEDCARDDLTPESFPNL